MLRIRRIVRLVRTNEDDLGVALGDPSPARESLSQRILDEQRRLYRAARVAYAHDLIALDLTMQQLKVIVLIDAMGGATSKQLARRLGIGPSTMSGIVDRLYENGLVLRAEDPSDRRVTQITLTAHGMDVVDRLDRGRRANASRLLGRLSEADLELVAGAYAAMADAAEVLADEVERELAWE
jgi:DNA-binding MarR family transcriptional regulator